MQPPAKEARKPFETGALTKNTAGKFFGVKIFVVLAVKYQRIDYDEEEGHAEGVLSTRASASSTIATVCGPYAQLLYGVLALIDSARRKGGLTKVCMF